MLPALPHMRPTLEMLKPGPPRRTIRKSGNTSSTRVMQNEMAVHKPGDGTWSFFGFPKYDRERTEMVPFASCTRVCRFFPCLTQKRLRLAVLFDSLYLTTIKCRLGQLGLGLRCT